MIDFTQYVSEENDNRYVDYPEFGQCWCCDETVSTDLETCPYCNENLDWDAYFYGGYDEY